MRRIGLSGDRIADVDLSERLDIADDVAYAADFEFVGRPHLRRKDADLGAFVDALMRHRHEARAGLEFAVDDAHVADNAAIRIELRVEDQRPQMIAMTLGRRDTR